MAVFGEDMVKAVVVAIAYQTILDLLGNKLKKPQKPIWIKVSRILSQKP